jgi:ABC-type oligopeptide transport system substrate-binding subunit
MRHANLIIAIAAIVAVASLAASAKESKSSSALMKGAVKGKHFDKIQVSTKTKPTTSTLKLDGIKGEAKDQQRH